MVYKDIGEEMLQHAFEGKKFRDYKLNTFFDTCPIILCWKLWVQL